MDMNLLNYFKRNLLGPGIILITIVIVFILFAFKQSPAHVAVLNTSSINGNDHTVFSRKDRDKKKIPVVEVIQVMSQQYTSFVQSQGRVQALWNTTLKAEVSGEVQKVSEHLLSGAVFKKGDVLVQIDPLQYELEVSNAEANIADAKYKLLIADKNRKNAIENWKAAGFFGEPTDLVVKKPQFEFAQAKMKYAILNLKKAKHDLDLTKIKAPYDGVVVNRKISPGSFLSLGNEIAEICSTEILFVSLPVTQKQISRLPDNITNLSITFTGENDQQQWQGRVSRLENIINSKSRVRNLIVNIEKNSFKLPLLGQFVKAEITATELNDIIIIPNTSISTDKLVWYVSDNNRLRVFKPKILFEKDNLSYVEVKFKNVPDKLSILVNPNDSLLPKATVDIKLKNNLSVNKFDDEV